MDGKERASKVDTEETCEVRSCGCSVNYLLLGLVVFFLVLFVASFIK